MTDAPRPISSLCPGCTYWMYTSMPMSFLYGGAQNMKRYSRGDLTGAEGKVHLSACWHCFSYHRKCWLSLPRGHLLSHVHLPAHQDRPHTLMPSSFPLVGPKTFTNAHSYFSLGEDLVFPFAVLNFISPSLEFPLSGSTTTPYICQLV